MVQMINRVILTGNLARDPELRYTPSGTAVCRFVLAVTRRYTNQQGEREADFITIVAWRQLGELVANYLKKGRGAAVEGRLQVRSYENNEGRKIYVTEVIADNVQFTSTPTPKKTNQTGPSTGSKEDPFDDLDPGDFPF